METRRNRLAGDFGGMRLFIFVLPTVIMMVFQGLYTIVDTVFVSYFAGTDALAAINVVTPLINLTVGLGTMLAAGGNAVIARNMGEGNGVQAKENFTLIILFTAGTGTLLALGTALRLDAVLGFLGAAGRILPFAKSYLGTMLLFLPFYMLQTVFANLFVTAGHPGLGSVLAILAGVLNILLDYIFIVCCGMGIRGAALGTGIGVCLPAVSGILFFCVSRKETLCFVKTHFKLKVIAESCFNGSSEMVGQLAGAVTTLLFNLSMLRLAGEDGVAAVTVINYSGFLFHTFYIGFSMGTAPLIGYNHGSGDRERQRKLLSRCVRFITAASGGVFLLCFFLSPVIAGIFAGESENVYFLALRGLRIFSLSFLFSGWNLFISSVFTAVSGGKTSALLSFLRTFVLLAAAILILPGLLGVTGIWLAAPAAELLAFGISYFLFHVCLIK